MMTQKLFIIIYLITTSFIFLIVCESSDENQSESPVSRPCQEFPLNGAMYGKRSAPALCRHSFRGGEYVDLDIQHEDEAEKYGGSAIRNSAPNPGMTQNGPSIQASIHPCVRVQKFPESEEDPFLVILCSGYLETKAQQGKSSWIKQLLGIN